MQPVQGYQSLKPTLEKSENRCMVPAVRTSEIKEVAERQPFRPFTVRLSNGAEYAFTEPRQFGAPKNFRIIVFFGDSEAVRIDTDSIVEVIEQ